MANTYYGFVERDASNFVNWAEVGRNFVNVIEEEGRVRQEKKAAIDENTRQLNERLMNLPMGESQTINNWMLKYGNIASENMRAQEKLLKSGKMRYKDYILQRQNLIDGTNSLVSTIEKTQARYADVLEKVKTGKAQPIQLKIWEQVEGFGDFSKTMPYVRADGKVIIGWADKAKYDGKDIMTLSDDPNYFTEINALNTRLSQDFDTWDVKAAMDGYVDEIGVELNSLIEAKNGLGATGTIRETLDITQRGAFPTDPIKVKEAYDKAVAAGFKGTQDQWVSNQKSLREVAMSFYDVETKKLESYLTNPLNVSSVLTQRITNAPNGKPYDVTFDPKARDENPNLVLMKTNGDGSAMPDFSGPVGEEQRKVALEFLRLEARLRYDKKSELTTTPQIQLQEKRPLNAQEFQNKSDEELAQNFARQTSFLITGNDEQAKAAISYFRGLGVDLEKNPKGKPAGIYIRNDAGALVPFESKGDPNKLGTSVVGALLKSSGIIDRLSDTKVVKYFPQFMGKSLNLTTAGTGVAAERDVAGEYQTRVFNNPDPAKSITYNDFLDQKSTDVIGKIQEAIGPVEGLVWDYSGGGSMTNKIKAIYNGVEYKMNSNQGNESLAKAQLVTLKSLVNAIKTNEKQKVLGEGLNYAEK